jgi:hypothetical protein
MRIMAFDYQGARKLSDTVLPLCAGDPGRTPRALALLSAGRAELGLGNHQEAIRCFREVESMTNKPFYMYWWWRMHAQLGLARTWLALVREHYQRPQRSRKVSGVRVVDGRS